MQTYSIDQLEDIHAANPRASNAEYRYPRTDPSIPATGVHGYSSTHHVGAHPIQHLKQTQAERNNARMEAALGIDTARRPTRTQYFNQQHNASVGPTGGKNKRRTKRKSLKNKKRKKKKSKTMKKKSKKSKK